MTVVLLDAVPSDAAALADCSEGPVRVLSLLTDGAPAARLIAVLKDHGMAVESLDAIRMTDSAVGRARKRLGRLLANGPDRPVFGGRTLKELLRFSGDLSAWWLLEPSSKRTDLYPAFTRICQIEALSEACRRGGNARVVLATVDEDFAEAVAHFCRERHLDLVRARVDEAPKTADRGLSLGRGLLRIIRLLTRAWIHSRIARRLYGRMGPTPEGRPGPVAFFSHYPNMWTGKDAAVDDKYRRVPHRLAGRFPGGVAMVVTASADGGHQSLTLRGYARACRALRERCVELEREGVRLVLADAELGLTDLWYAARRIRDVVRLSLLMRRSRFRALWREGDLDAFPLLRTEFRTARWRLPGYALQAARIRRVARLLAPAAWVFYLFEFCYGRATLHGIRRGSPNAVSIGVQHGPISLRKMIAAHWPAEVAAAGDWVRGVPLPDLILVEGRQAHDVLLRDAIPEARVMISGAPRLMASRTFTSGTAGSARRGVLVAPGQHDGEAVIRACAPLTATGEWRFCFKLHPRSSFDAARTERILAEWDPVGVHWEISDRPVEGLLAEVATVVTTYSSVGLEAYEDGLGVVCLLLPGRVNVSPLLDGTLPGVLTAVGPDELRDALRALNDMEGRPDNPFFASRGVEAERVWVGAILSALNHRAES